MLELLTDVLKRLRKLAAEHAQTFRSDGFRRLLATLSVSVDLGSKATPAIALIATMPCERRFPAKQR